MQAGLPIAPWLDPRAMRLPGVAPAPFADWLIRDEAYAAQMALRDRLIATRAAAVHGIVDAAAPAAEELRDLLLERLGGAPGYARAGGQMRRPDGVAVGLDAPPLLVAGRLAQEDFCLLEKPECAAEHVLTGAILCFPSHWTLAEKLGRPLSRIHRPVERYDPDVARRAQRLCDGLRPGVVLARANVILNSEPGLFLPRSEAAADDPADGPAAFVRVERQTFLRLPRTGAIVFAIHTFKVAAASLTRTQRAGLEALRPDALAPPTETGAAADAP